MNITENSNLGQVLKDCPQSVDIFVKHGFKQLRDSASMAAQAASQSAAGPPCASLGWPEFQIRTGQASIKMAAFYMGMSREKIDALVKDLVALEC